MTAWDDIGLRDKSDSRVVMPANDAPSRDSFEWLANMDLFWAKVDKNGPVPSHRPELGPCWLWIGSRTKDGYGLWRGTKTAKQKLTHRVAWTIERGPIPEGLLLCHHCDNPPCVRPDHMFLGTNADNMADCASKGRTKEQRGSSHALTKLTEADVIAMRDAWWTRGEKLKSIAERFGIRESTASYIPSRSHVESRADACRGDEA